MNKIDYDAIAEKYRERYGEDLVAAAEWVEPFFEACFTVIECDPSLDLHGPAVWREAIERTADVIAVMTYGVQHAQLTRATTAGRRYIEGIT